MDQSDGSVIIDTSMNLKGFHKGVYDIKKAYTDLAASTQKTAQNMRDSLTGTPASNLTDEFKAISAQIEKTEKDLNRAIERKDKFLATGGKENSNQFRKYQYDIDNITRVLREAKAELDALIADGKAYTPSVSTNAVQEVEGELSRVDAAVDASQKTVNRSAKIWRTFSASLKTILAPVKAATTMFKKLASIVADAAASLANLAAKSIAKTAKRFGQLFKIQKKSNSGFSGGLKNVLKYTLGIRSLFVLFNRLRSAIRDGFENLAQFSNKTNASISQILSAFTRLKNSLATAFAPIVDAVAPALTRLIDYLSEAATHVGMLIAALAGQKQFTRAIAVLEDYAKSLKQTANATKNLSGLDEIHTFDNESSGIDTGKATPDRMFETVDIPNIFSVLATRLKEAIAGIDLTALGASITTKISAALGSISWEKIQSKCSGIAYSISTFINGAFSSPAIFESAATTIIQGVSTAIGAAMTALNTIDWNAVDASFADGLNAAVRVALTALTTIDWTAAGASIASGLNTLISTIDWAAVGQLFANGLNTIIGTALTVLTTIDWTAAGASIASGLNSLVSDIDWAAVGELLAARFMMAVNVLLGAVTTFDWENAGTALATGLNTLMNGIDWANLGQLLGSSFMAIINLLLRVISTFDWKGTGAALATGVNNIVTSINWSDVGKMLSDGIKGLLDFLIEFVVNTDWQALGNGIAEMIGAIDWNGIVDALVYGIGAALAGLALLLWGIIEDAWSKVVDWWEEVAYEDGKFTFEGLLNGILDVAGNILKWINDHIFVPFIDGFKKVFGIHSPAKTMEDPGKNILLGMLEGMKTGFATVIDWLLYIPKRIGEIFGDVIDTVKAIAKGDWKSAWESFKKIFSDIWDALVDVVKRPINLVIGLINGMLDGIEKGVNFIIDAVNKLSFKVPDWVPAIGGKEFGFNLPRVSINDIPYLAKGAVIPPNAPFAAVLGDQRRGVNVEAPLETIKDAVRQVLAEKDVTNGSENTYRFTAQIGRRVVFDEIITEAKLRQSTTGKNPFSLA